MTSWLDFYASFLSMSALCMPSWAAKFDPGEVLVQNCAAAQAARADSWLPYTQGKAEPRVCDESFS